jgi:dTMP kinase
MRGFFIVFEGGEGSGKTTQLQLTYEWLDRRCPSPPPTEGLKSSEASVILTRQPGGTQLGVALRQLLLETPRTSPLAVCDRAELLLFAADRAQHVETLIQPSLTRGAIVLSDRYIESTIAYQGYGRGLDLPLIHQLNQIATAGRMSDLTLWLDVDPEIGLARAHQRGETNAMEQETLAFHQRVRQGYAEIARSAPDRVVRIDAARPIAIVQAEIQAIVASRLP